MSETKTKPEIKKAIPTNTITRTLKEIDTPTGNLYESVNVIAARANEISTITKTDLQQKLQDFAGASDNLEETFENREQIEISKHYERLPKAVLVSTEEFLNGKVKIKRARK